MTLECGGVVDMLRAVATRRGAAEEKEGRRGDAAAGGVPPPIGDWGWNEAAASRGRVLLERRVVRRRKVEENRMAAIAGSGFYSDLRECDALTRWKAPKSICAKDLVVRCWL